MFFDSQLNKVTQAQLSEFNIIDPFSIDFSAKHYDEFTDQELLALPYGTQLMFDCEVYKNYFLASFKHPETKKIVCFEDDDEQSTVNTAKLKWLLSHFCIVGFHSYSYDIPIIAAAILGATCSEIKEISNKIIYENMHRNDIEAVLGSMFKIDKFKIPALNHIDLIEVAPLKASLKLYSGRLHCQRMHEINIDPEKELTHQEKQIVKLYNINDLDNTGLLRDELIPALELRNQLSREYQVDLRSRSDAQLAEEIIKTELKKLTGYWPKKPTVKAGTCYKYKVEPYMQFQTPQLQNVLNIVKETWFKVSETGSLELPDALKGLTVSIGSSDYTMGIGGLHSTEKSISHKADENTLLIDKDVASYYPSIILNQGLCPEHLGRNFLKVYRGIVNRRLEAKRLKNKIVDQSLKITINGTFGKLGNKWSIMYSPECILQVLLTSQLALLLLIESLECSGISVVSANTDGVLIKCAPTDYNKMEAAVIWWQKCTGFQTEETRYKAVYSRDVNNYIAIKEDDSIKVKGTYAEKGSSGNSVLSKNPENAVVNNAILRFISNNNPIHDTIMACRDITQFLTVRQVKGGGQKSGVFLGKSVRWYYSTKIQGEINYCLTGNKVPNTENAMPLMDLPLTLPDDIDYDRYIRIANEALKDIGYYSNGPIKAERLF